MRLYPILYHVEAEESMGGTTQFLGQMISLYLVATGVGFFVSKDYYRKMLADSGRSDSITINLSGMVHFLLGLAIVLNHNRWRTAPETSITVIGFAASLKGAALIVVPQAALKGNDMSAGVLRITGAAFVVVGGYLGFVTYFGSA